LVQSAIASLILEFGKPSRGERIYEDKIVVSGCLHTHFANLVFTGYR
jgi:hypothetical protein